MPSENADAAESGGGECGWFGDGAFPHDESAWCAKLNNRLSWWEACFGASVIAPIRGNRFAAVSPLPLAVVDAFPGLDA